MGPSGQFDGMSTMYDVRRPLAVEVQRGSHEGKILFTVLNEEPASFCQN